MAEARITEFFGETQIREKVLDFMGLGSCMPGEAWRLPSPQTLHCRIEPYPAVSCRILPYPAVSCRILPYRIRVTGKPQCYK